MKYKLSQKSLDKMNGVHPDLVRVIKLAIEITPRDFGITQGVRTQAEQDDLYAQGRTKPGKIVTWTRNSKHIKQADGYGHAIDFVAYDGGKISWDEKHYPEIIKAILEAARRLGVKVVSGSQWTNQDLPHVELAT